MGYRSNIAIAITSDCYNDASDDFRTALEELFDDHLIGEEHGNHLFRSDSIKWDVFSYPEVDIVEKYLNEADSSLYRLVRIGDDFEDVEIRGDLDEDFTLWVSRDLMVENSEGNQI